MTEPPSSSFGGVEDPASGYGAAPVPPVPPAPVSPGTGVPAGGAPVPPAAPIPPAAAPTPGVGSFAADTGVPPGVPPVPPNGAPVPPVGAPVPPTAGPDSRFGGGALQGFDPKTVNPLDWGIIAVGVLMFIFSFTPYYSYSLKSGGLHLKLGTWSAWHGFFGWFAVLLVVIAAGLLGANLIAKVSLPFPLRLVVLAGFAVALLSMLLALVVIPLDTRGLDIDKGHSWGYWLSLILVIAGTALAYLRFTQTGGKLPRRR